MTGRSSGIDAWATDPLPTESHKFLTAALAVEAAQAAIAACKAQGYNVTVTVAHRMGHAEGGVIVREGPPGVGTEVARRKAYTAAAASVVAVPMPITKVAITRAQSSPWAGAKTSTMIAPEARTVKKPPEVP